MYALILCIVAILAPETAPAAPLTNLSFETNLMGWTASGDVQRILPGPAPGQNTWGQPGFTATDGRWVALVSTAPDPLFYRAPGIDSGEDRDGNGRHERDLSTLTQSFTATTSFSLSFDWTVATSEFDGYARHNDIAGARLISDDGDAIPLLQLATDNGSYTGGFTPLSSDDFTIGGWGWGTADPHPSSSFFENGTYRGGVRTATRDLIPAGSYTLEFFAGDDANGRFDTGLFVDNVRVTAVPEPISLSLVAMLFPIVAFSRHR